MPIHHHLSWLGLTKIEGIKANESVFHRIRCKYQEILGDLVLTNKGIVFLEIKGMIGQGRERLHQFDFDDIRRIQTKKKISGIFRHGIVLDHQSNSLENQSYYYSCEEHKAVLFLAFFERQKLLLRTPETISSTIQSLSTIKRNADLLKVSKDPKLRPYFFAFSLDKIETELLNLLKHNSDVDLSEVALSKQMHSLIALLYESDPRKIPKDQIYYTVTDLVAHLILRNELDGIITEVGRYVSNRALARITVPLDMLADFETIYFQLYEKGLIIWEIECPNCFRRIKYPKKGKKIACEFCKEDIHAIDVFKKFVDLL
jgi:hypothetical protein